ncbi:MAG TPA: threonine dehydratase [Ilumatobacteraceae bacterium]|nr:threonine dehydratase [Ilumatobacteraceae bacterium]
MFTLDDLDRAETIVYAHMPPTPQYAWPLLAHELGTEVWVKHENHTPTGAFKVRGGLVHLERLREWGDVAGIIGATRGNHGQSLAFAGRATGLPVVIVAPYGNSVEKNAAMRGLGAELIESGHDFQAALEDARRIGEERQLQMVPSFHPDLVQGVATYARELFLGAPALDTVYVPVGLGSGICGLILVRDLLGLPTEIVGVVSDRAPAYRLSFEAGAPVSTATADTFVDGVACRVPDPLAVDIICRGAARVIEVPDEATADAMRILHRTTHNTAEPAGAIALAGAISERHSLAGSRVAVVITGGNVDTDVLAGILNGNSGPPPHPIS